MLWLLIMGMVLLLGFLIGGLLGAPWVPTFRRDVESVLDDSKLKSGQLFIELGCGDGRLVAAAAKRGAKAIGYEINPLLWLVAWVRNFRHKHAHVRLANFWLEPIDEADVVMTFLLPRFMNRLEQKTKQEMKPGSYLVTYVFKLPSQKPSKSTDHWFVYHF